MFVTNGLKPGPPLMPLHNSILEADLVTLPSLPKTIPLPKTCCAGSTHWNERQLVHNNSPD